MTVAPPTCFRPRRPRPAVRLLAVVLLAMLATAAAATHASGARITGVADENLAGWDPFATSAFDAIDVPQVRHIVPWDVALDPAGTAALQRWIATARAHGKRVLISFGGVKGAPFPAPTCAPRDPLPCPTLNYRYAIDRFRAAFPDVTELTAWNEPNHALGGATPPPELAASWWNQLDAACRAPSATGQTCTVAAGDFSDFDSLRSYVSAYRAALHRTPDEWAVHAYHAINPDGAAGTAVGLTKLADWVAGATDGRPVWITEVGAYYCTAGVPVAADAAAVQNAAALELNALMASPSFSRVARVYYYFFAPPAGMSARCPRGAIDPAVEEDDPGLIGAGDTPRPALWTLFPALADAALLGQDRSRSSAQELMQ
jgi:Glycosyl hydrolase catalytic core